MLQNPGTNWFQNQERDDLKIPNQQVKIERQLDRHSNPYQALARQASEEAPWLGFQLYWLQKGYRSCVLLIIDHFSRTVSLLSPTLELRASIQGHTLRSEAVSGPHQDKRAESHKTKPVIPVDQPNHRQSPADENHLACTQRGFTAYLTSSRYATCDGQWTIGGQAHDNSPDVESLVCGVLPAEVVYLLS